MTKVGFISLGCSKNQVDAEVMLHALADAGYALVGDETEADIIIINTCGFIESAKRESIENILDVAWLKENRSLRGIVVTGCMAERYRESIFEELPEVDALLGVGSIEDIVAAVSAVDRGERGYTSFRDKERSPLGGARILTTPAYSVYMKIAEGCDNRCTYCAIPMIRGRMRSRPIEELVEEAKVLAASGAKELNLIAQDTSRYGLDLYGRYALTELVQAITRETDIPWVRLLYCYPDKITDELIAELRDNPRLVKYMDIPIQHINDRVLTDMNRHGSSALIRETVEKLRREVPGITLRTTAIVGFPGEGDAEFEELCAFVKEARFDRFGAFTYSPEEDTPAAEMAGQVDEQVKQDRYDILMQTQLPISEELQAEKIGTVITVLCEGYDRVAGTHFGRSAADAPDIDGKVYFSAPRRVAEGKFVQVKITEALDYDLVGEVLED